MFPDPASEVGVVRRQLDRVHMGRRRRTGDPQRAVPALGAQFENDQGIGPFDRGVEELALDIADVDEQ